MDRTEKTSVQESQLVGVKRNADASGIADATSNDEPLSKLFKLNHDCLECVFEWLSLAELLTIRRTCKQMKQMIDFYIKLNYPQVVRSSIYTNRRLLELGEAQLDCFQWINHLYISRLELSGTHTESIKYILYQLESLELHLVKIDGATILSTIKAIDCRNKHITEIDYWHWK